MREFVLKHVAPVKNKNVNFKCAYRCLVCVCVSVFVCMRVQWCAMCVLAAIREAVKTHRGALEVFYHAAVIAACLLMVTLRAVFLQGTILEGSTLLPSHALLLYTIALSFTIKFYPLSLMHFIF